MWAVQYHRYGDPSVLRREEIEPPELADGEVLVQTASSGVSAIDLLYRSGAVRMHGFGFPKQPGFDALGVVRASRNPDIPEGRWVWTVLGLEPFRRRGTAVEHLALDRSRVGAFPAGWTPDIAVGALPLGALTALRCLRNGARVSAGARLLVVGAGGAVGTAALQLAQLLGARPDAVCGASALDLCRELGAGRAYDRADDLSAVQTSGTYDAVLVAAGRGTDWLGAARRGGRTVFSRLDSWVRTLPSATRQRVTTAAVAAGHDAGDLTELASLVAEGRLRPVVGATYGIDELARAHRDYGHGGTAGARLVVH